MTPEERLLQQIFPTPETAPWPERPYDGFDWASELSDAIHARTEDPQAYLEVAFCLVVKALYSSKSNLGQTTTAAIVMDRLARFLDEKDD